MLGTVTLKDLKTTIKIATKMQQPDGLNWHRKDENRDISLDLKFYPDNNPKEDIYPYWVLTLTEEDRFRTIYFGKNDLQSIKDIVNGFACSFESKQSFIDLLPVSL